PDRRRGARAGPGHRGGHPPRPPGHAAPDRRRPEERRVINWLSQVASVTLYNLRTLPERKGSALTTIVGITGVVAVFVGVLSMAEGFRAAMTATGPDDVALVLRSSADGEMTSNFTREEVRLIK